MGDKPISFTVANFSEQIVPPRESSHYAVYSAVMHVDGVVYQCKKAINPQFEVPISSLRTEAWVNLLRQISEGK